MQRFERKTPNTFVLKPTTRPGTCWSELSCSVYGSGKMAVELGGTRLREMKRIENSISFVFEPAKAYSERLTKSNGVLWKLKEVFEPLTLPGPQRDFLKGEQTHWDSGLM